MKTVSLLSLLLCLACGRPDDYDCDRLGHVQSCTFNDAGELECADAGWRDADWWNDLHPGLCRPEVDAGVVDPR